MDKLIKELEIYIDKRKPCVVCKNNKFSLYAEEGYFQALKCDKCGMISVNPHYTEEGLDKFYRGFYKKRSSKNELSLQRRIMYEEDQKWIQNYIQGGKVLDIGCSDGSFLSFFSEKLWDRHGIDLTKDALKFARNRKITTYQGKIWKEDVGSNYDLVMMRGTIEHFRDPNVVLKKCSEIFKPGGIMGNSILQSQDAAKLRV